MVQNGREDNTKTVSTHVKIEEDPGKYDTSKSRWNTLDQRFPNFSARGPLLTSKNNLASSLIAHVSIDCPDDDIQN